MTKALRRLFCCFIMYFLTCFILIHPVLSEESANEEIPLNQYGIRSTNPYVVDRFVENGKLIDKIIVPSMPYPPEGFSREVAMVPEPNIAYGTNTISNVPAMTWCFGCSATSAAMMFGHYDNTDYPNMYAGPTNDGVFPMTNEVWGTVVINEEIRALCPLSATRLGLDSRTTKGHVDDYWIKYDDPGPDPFIGNWTEHTYIECTGDYMGTNQSLLNNTDGSTIFYNYPDGDPIYDYTECEPDNRDGCHGMREFVESRGYTVQTLGNFNQYIYGYNGNTKGFTFEDFKTEIDAGRPVLIHVEGHTMLGYGYNETGSIIYIHDTWDYENHEMTWGGSYSGMAHSGVSVLKLRPVTAASSIYVSQDGTCNGNTHCYSTIQAAINAAATETTIKIVGGVYNEALILNSDKNLTLEGGYDSAFTSQSSETIANSLTINHGKITADHLVLQSGGTITTTTTPFTSTSSSSTSSTTSIPITTTSSTTTTTPSGGSIVTFCTETNCGSGINFTLGTVTNSYKMYCGSPAGFSGVPAGTYSYSAYGCGINWTGSLYVNGTGSYIIWFCPPSGYSCCPSGCGTGGAFRCTQCGV